MRTGSGRLPFDMHRFESGFVGVVLVPLVLLSLAVGAYARSHGFSTALQVRLMDPADFRYLAETFWGVPHDMQSYGRDFHKAWGTYLDRVPFREITIGSYYLLVQSVGKLVHPGDSFSARDMGTWYSMSLIAFLCAAFWCLYDVIRRRYGVVIASLTIAVLAMPVENWLFTRALLAEPFLRIVVVLACAALLRLAFDEKRRGLWAACLGFLLLACAQIKAHWMLLSVLLLPAVILQWHWNHWKWRPALPLIGAVITVPLSLIFVHAVGWGIASAAPGFALHLNHRTNGALIKAVCAEESAGGREPPLYCIRRGPDFIGFWSMNFSADGTASEYGNLDARARSYALSRPRALLRNFSAAFDKFVVVPGPLPLRPGALHNLEQLVVLLTWVILAAGLFHRKTFLLSAAGIGLWVFAASSMVFEHYEARHFFAMAGIPTVLALLIVVELWQPILQHLPSRQRKTIAAV